MLNPEVERFPAPESHVSYTRYPWDQHHQHGHFIQRHPFNTQVSLLLPDSPIVPAGLREILTCDTEFYHITSLPLHQLSTPTFIQVFINTGQVYALSCDTRLDVDDSACLMPDGCLHLLLGKFTYHQLPLSGHLSRNILRTPKERFVVEVNLKEPGIEKRVGPALRQVNLAFNWWLVWLPNGPEVCPSSIAKYFQDLGYSVSERQADLRQDVMPVTQMPSLTNLQGEEGQEVSKEQEGKPERQDEMEPEDVLEWIGCQALGINLSGDGMTACDIMAPQPSVPIINLCSAHCSGLFTPTTISTLVQGMRKWLEGRSEEDVPWVGLTVYGHPDSPVSWAGLEHTYGASGDNLYTLILTRDHIRAYKVSGPRKPHRLYVKANNNK